MNQAKCQTGWWRRAGRIAINVLLVVVILGLIAAMWYPVYKGVSPDRPDQDEFGFPRARQHR